MKENRPLAADMTLFTASLVAWVELAVWIIVSPRCFTGNVVVSSSVVDSLSGTSPRSRKLVARTHSSQSSGNPGKVIKSLIIN